MAATNFTGMRRTPSHLKAAIERGEVCRWQYSHVDDGIDHEWYFVQRHADFLPQISAAGAA